MPSLLPVDPAKRCSVIKANGVQCGGIRLTTGEKCRAHTDPHNIAYRATASFNPSLSVQALVRLDVTQPTELQRFRIGLLEHIALGSLDHQAASAMLRIAQQAYDSQPHKVKETALGGMMAKLMATEPKPVDG